MSIDLTGYHTPKEFRKLMHKFIDEETSKIGTEEYSSTEDLLETGKLMSQ